jgi:hypothetical protein
VDAEPFYLAADPLTSPLLLYQATAKAIQQVIGECYGFEYYILPETLDWLVCENHHGQLIAVGELAVARLEQFAFGRSGEVWQVDQL